MKNLSKNKKIALGIGSIWFLIFSPIFQLFILSLGGSAPHELPEFPPQLLIIILLLILTILLYIVLLIRYIFDVTRNHTIKTPMKILWIVLFSFVCYMAMPVYWYLHVWKFAERKTVSNKSR